MGGKDEGRSGRKRRRRGGGSSRREDPGRNAREENAVSSRDRNRFSGETCAAGGRRGGAGKSGVPRLRWTPPALDTRPLPEPDCFYCGKPIRDISVAIQDKDSGQPVHFDCALARLTETERLDSGDVLSYIGGGRFGVVHFTESRAGFRNRLFQADSGRYENGPPGRVFTIKKIVEWENRENRPDWRVSIADHYSIT